MSFGLSWFGLFLIPSSMLVMLDRGEAMAEHRLYTASTGFFLAAGGVAAVIEERLSRTNGTLRKRAQGVGFLVVALLSMLTIARNAVWHRPVSLWREATGRAPDHWFPRLGLGQALHEDGRHKEAIEMFRESLERWPRQTLAYSKLGQCQLEMGYLSEAQESFTRLQALAQDSAAAPFGLGLVALRVGDLRGAREYFLKTFERDPNNVPMRQALAQATQETNPAEALRLCQEIQRLAPQTPGNDECISLNRERLRAGERREELSQP